MQVLVDPKLQKLVESLGENIVKAVDEGLNLWLKEKLTTCPITKKFCTNNQNPCNECETFTKNHPKNTHNKIRFPPKSNNPVRLI